MRPGERRPATRKDLIVAIAATVVLFLLCGLVAAAAPFEWALVAWIVLFPASVFVLGAPDMRRARRLRRGLCPSCGYDRRGLAGDAPCPECGAAAPSK